MYCASVYAFAYLVTVGLCAHQSISYCSVCYPGHSTLFQCVHSHIHCEAISFIT